MQSFFNPKARGWRSTQAITNQGYVCGYCNHRVSTDRGYKLGDNSDGSGSEVGGLYICPNCQGPTFFAPDGRRYPKPAFGEPVDKLPEELDALYEEARRCTSQQCHTAAVLLCRKILMNIAVDQGAPENAKFIKYVNYLADKGYIPPNGKHWVDHIRKKGNEANHEIAIMNADDAKDLLVFTEMLLKFIYEFPSMVSAPEGPESTPSGGTA
jgi:hypothetical protein